MRPDRTLVRPAARRVLCGFLIASAAVTAAHRLSAQQQQGGRHAADVARIRELAAGSDRGLMLDSAIFWSGAYARPVVGLKSPAKPLDSAAMANRRNTTLAVRPRRIEVAQAGDMAYEFSDFTLSMDMATTNQHHSFTGSMLRVWQKVNGEWKIAAQFMRPHDDQPMPEGAQKKPE